MFTVFSFHSNIFDDTAKKKKKNLSKKSEMQETLERGWDCHVNRICIWFSLTKLKRKKRKFKGFDIITKVFSHELKEPYFTGMNLRGCLASFFTFAGELNFTNNKKKFLKINLILYFSFCSYLLYLRNKKLFVRHVNQILYSSIKNMVQKNFMSVISSIRFLLLSK